MFSFSGISGLTDSSSILDFPPSYFSIFVVFFYFRQEMLPYIIAVDCSVSCFMCICTFVITFFHSLCVCVCTVLMWVTCHSTHLVFFFQLYTSVNPCSHANFLWLWLRFVNQTLTFFFKHHSVNLMLEIRLQKHLVDVSVWYPLWCIC